MRVFVDTSALLALLDSADQYHGRASAVWQTLLAEDAALTCTNYVLVEVFALAQHRLGMAAVRTLQDDIIPMLHFEWLAAEGHARGVSALLAANRRQLSLVDCASFDAMRSAGLTTVFTFDRHFAEQGFQCLPQPSPPTAA